METWFIWAGIFRKNLLMKFPSKKKLKILDIHLHLEGTCKIDSIKNIIFIMRYRQTKITNYYRPKDRLFKNRKNISKILLKFKNLSLK